jgi:hypothetical protein
MPDWLPFVLIGAGLLCWLGFFVTMRRATTTVVPTAGAIVWMVAGALALFAGLILLGHMLGQTSTPTPALLGTTIPAR